MKAVIVFDVDSDFDFDQKLWVQIEEYLDGEILESGCHAVKPLPERWEGELQNSHPLSVYSQGMRDGFNMCLEEITE